MPLGERVQRLAVEKGLRHLALELDAAGLLWRMGFHPSKARLPGQFHFLNLPGPRGALQIHNPYDRSQPRAFLGQSVDIVRSPQGIQIL